MVRLEPLRAEEVNRLKDQILNVYQAAFSPPPYNKLLADLAGFAGILTRHTERPGFKCIAARKEEDGEVVGFSYGYTSAPGQWWHDIVTGFMGPQLAARWLSDCFEFVELALHPRYQGQGCGGALHDLLLDGLPHRTAALSTLQVETTALHMYRKRGWTTILDEVTFPNTRKSYRIMGKDLNPSLVSF